MHTGGRITGMVVHVCVYDTNYHRRSVYIYGLLKFKQNVNYKNGSGQSSYFLKLYLS